MAKYYSLVIIGILASVNLYAHDNIPSIELIEFLADWEQEDDFWLNTKVSTTTATTEQEADDETEE